MNKSQMRVAIAKDVIKLLKETKRLVVRDCCTYFEQKGRITKTDVAKNRQLSEKIKKCTVCALGAMMVAHLDRFDGFSCKEYANRYLPNGRIDLLAEDIYDKLSEYFDDRTLNNIEDAFEFGWMIKSPEKRLIAIMEKVIELKGGFSTYHIYMSEK